jgi:tetratricopeptide (TPR) repeat protein
LIDALRWDSKNGYALLMMGNIQAKFLEDIPTAMKYYDQALIANPNDHVTINNIGANLLQQGRLEEAKKYFWNALNIESNYPNSHLSLSIIAEKEQDLASAFYSAVRALQSSSPKEPIYNNALQQVFDLAKRMSVENAGLAIYTDYKQRLEKEGKRRIVILKDDQIATAAKMEFAENYKRENHTVRFKPGYPAVEHLIMHELVHLEFVLDARKNQVNKLFVSNNAHKKAFEDFIATALIKLSKKGYNEALLQTIGNSLFEGINAQTYNTPIDLFIEDYLYNEFPDLRPYQFLSLFALNQEGVKAVTDKRILDFAPKEVLSQSKVYNLVNALQFKDLYGIDTIKQFAATPKEIQLANDFFAEYQDYRNNRDAGEEYELVQHWAEDLGLNGFFKLVPEENYHQKGSDIESFLAAIEKDPLGLNADIAEKDAKMKTFLEKQQAIGTNMAVVMFMVEALQFFEQKKTEEIKKIALEIAMQGTQGFDPKKDHYRLHTIPNKKFSGYQILAYYYTSFALALPEMLAKLNLPFEKEFEIAKSI